MQASAGGAVLVHLQQASVLSGGVWRACMGGAGHACVCLYTPSHLVAQLQSVSCGSGSQQCVNAPSAGASTCLTRARPDSESAARRVCSGACQLPRWSHGLQVGSTDTAVFASRTVVLLSPSRCCSGSYRSGPGKPHSKPRLSCTECVCAVTVGGARAATVVMARTTVMLNNKSVRLRSMLDGVTPQVRGRLVSNSSSSD